MKGFLYVMGKIFRLFSSTKLYMPKAFAGVFIIWQLISEGLKLGWIEAFSNFGLRVFSAEYIIHTNVNIAINTPELFTFVNLLDILNSVLIAYFVIKFIAEWGLMGITGSQAPKMAYAMAIGIYLLIEITTAVILGKFERVEKNIPLLNETVNMIKLDFIPIKDGLVYLFLNINQVVGAVDWFWLKQLGFR